MTKKTGRLRSIAVKALDIIFPRVCCICSTPFKTGALKYICSICRLEIKPLTHPFCSICSLPFGTDHIVNKDYMCGNCKTNMPYFDSSFSLSLYEGILKCVIQIWKYNKKACIIDDLHCLINASKGLISECIEGCDCIVPVPLHYRGLKSRGFDQSFLLGLKVAETFKLPLINNRLIRKRLVQSQATLKKRQRIKNIAGAFKVNFPKDVEGKHILLVDDVMTTSATANECSKVLKRAGAVKVTVFTLARTAI